MKWFLYRYRFRKGGSAMETPTIQPASITCWGCAACIVCGSCVVALISLVSAASTVSGLNI